MDEQRRDFESRERIAVLETEMANVKLLLERMDKKMDDMSNTLLEAKGGWRMLMLLGGGAAVLGGATVKFVESFMLAFPK